MFCASVLGGEGRMTCVNGSMEKKPRPSAWWALISYVTFFILTIVTFLVVVP